MSAPAGDDLVRASRDRFEAAGVRALAMTMVDNGGITRGKPMASNCSQDWMPLVSVRRI